MDIKTAYKVMYEFMNGYYHKTQADDIGCLVSSMSFLCDGWPAYSGYWYDWTHASRKVKKDNLDEIDNFTAYKIMIQFIKDYNDIGSLSDIEVFYDMIKLKDEKADPKVWHDWLIAVESVKKDPSDEKFLLRDCDGKVSNVFNRKDLNFVKERLGTDIRIAYKIMYEFMDTYYWKTKPEYIGCLVSSMSFLCDGTTADTAIWYEWIGAAKKVKKDNLNEIDNFTAYKMMIQFIKDYNDIGSFPDTEVFYDMIKLKDEKADPKVWKDWLVAVESVKKDPSDERFLLKLMKP